MWVKTFGSSLTIQLDFQILHRITDVHFTPDKFRLLARQHFIVRTLTCQNDQLIRPRFQFKMHRILR